MNPPSERRFPRIPFAKVEAGASPASSLEDLIEAVGKRGQSWYVDICKNNGPRKCIKGVRPCVVT